MNGHLSRKKLGTFVTKVIDFENDGLLTPKHADELLQRGQAIRDAIGCDIGDNVNAQDVDVVAETDVTYISLLS